MAGLTREQLEEMGAQPVGLTAQQLQSQGARPLDGFGTIAKAQEPQKSLGQKVLDAGTSVANFFGAKGISEQFGADIARAQAPQDQKNLIAYPSFKQVAGSALQTGANFIPGAGTGASLATKVGMGAATGYAMDVGSKLQDPNRSVSKSLIPGIGTAIGGALPLAGAAFKLGNSASAAKKLANNLEKSNLRMTPVEQQKLKANGKDIVDWLSHKKIVGTPDRRYTKVVELYDDMERQITRKVDGSGVSYSKSEIIERLKNIPQKYYDNLSEYDGVINKVERIINTLDNTRGDAISASAVNTMKRKEWQNAYNKNNSDVINEISDEVGHVLKELLDEKIDGLQSLNKEYGMTIAAKRQLFKASTRNQAGVFTRAAGVVGGTAIGGALGGGLGAGAGAYAGDKIANALATPLRSAAGAAAQVGSEAIKSLPLRGVVQPARKALLQGLQQGRGPAEAPPETPLQPELQSELSPPDTTTMGTRVNDDGSITTKGPFSGKEFTIDPNAVGGTVKSVAKLAPRIKSLLKAEPPYSLFKGLEVFVTAYDDGFKKIPQGFDSKNDFEGALRGYLEKFGFDTSDLKNSVDLARASAEILRLADESPELLRDALGRFIKKTQ
jgi:hypothetical protein